VASYSAIASASNSSVADNQLLFTTSTGQPIEPRNLKRSFDARCKKAGVRQIKINDTRRTCSSLLAALDVHPRVAMAILWYSRIALTMEVYTGAL
jgi:hypothetical protein